MASFFQFQAGTRWLRTLAAGLLLGTALVAVEPPSVKQQTLKAAFICHFLNLTRWPEQRAHLVVGIYGSSRMGDDLAAAMPNTAGTLSISLVRVQPDATDWASLNALYIPSSYQADVPLILKRLGTNSVLTIGDSSGFVEEGGMIGFVQEGSKLRFEISQGMAAKKGLQFSAKLLELARSVQR